jgi:two-component system, OmpR family, response regulator
MDRPATDAHDTALAGAARPLRVLVVEDLPRVQVLLRELIDEPGRFEIAGMAETEHEAIEQYQALQPDALVIDLNLRQGTGLGVIMGVRRTPAARRPLLLVLTNHALPVLEAACLSAGADHFLDKSRDFHKVRPLLEQARSQGAPGTSH